MYKKWFLLIWVLLMQNLCFSKEINSFSTEINVILSIVLVLSLSFIVFAFYHFRYIRLYKENLTLSKENTARKELLDNTLSVMREGVVSFDTELNIIDINTAARQMSGGYENPIGCKFEDVFSTTHPEDGEPIQDLLSKSLLSKEGVKIANHTRINYKDSDFRVIAGNITPVIDSLQNVSQLVLVFRDVTESHKQKRFLSIAVESAKSYTWFCNTYNNMFVFGDNFQKVYGMEAQNQASMEVFIKKVHPDDREKILLSLENIVNNKIRNFSFEYRISFNDDNNYEWWERRGVAYTDNMPDNEVKYVYGMDINIDEHKERENELLDAKLKAEESDRLKSAFLANMSHEIRTPLNGILGFASLITDPDYTKVEKKEFVKVINSSSKSLMNLINDILDLSRIESNTINFEIVPTDLSVQIREIYESYKLTLNANVSLVLDLPEKSAVVNIDSSRNGQVLTNLINNALKYTENGEIHVGYSEGNGYVEIFISDNGRSINKEQLGNLFERFYKVDDFVSDSGLGLSICKAIVERSGGKIWAESEQGKGTVIRYTIPIQHNHESNQTAVIPEETIKCNDLKPLILIAEDIESNYKFLETVLSKTYDVLWARNGIEAVEIFKTRKPTLILMDIKMPIMDGLEATKMIREISPTVPIFAQTANVFESDRKAAYDVGCNEVITKPINTSLLLMLAKKYL